MKIHIVQKGDTLWKLAKKYGVSFDELKKLNSQLSNPDMIMPGMKLKIPGVGAVKNPTTTKKEAKINVGSKKEAPVPGMQALSIKEAPKTAPAPEMQALPIKEAPKPMPVPIQQAPVVHKETVTVKEMPKKEIPIVQHKPVVPVMPQPIIPEVDINNYYMVNMANMNVQKPVVQPQQQPAMPKKEKPVQIQPMPQPQVKPQPLPAEQCIPVTPIMPGPGFCPPFYPMHHHFHGHIHGQIIHPLLSEESSSLFETSSHMHHQHHHHGSFMPLAPQQQMHPAYMDPNMPGFMTPFPAMSAHGLHHHIESSSHVGVVESSSHPGGESSSHFKHTQYGHPLAHQMVQPVQHGQLAGFQHYPYTPDYQQQHPKMKEEDCGCGEDTKKEKLSPIYQTSQPQFQQPSMMPMNPNQHHHQPNTMPMNPNQHHHQPNAMPMNPNQHHHQPNVMPMNPNQHHFKPNVMPMNPNQHHHQPNTMHMNPNQHHFHPNVMPMNPNQHHFHPNAMQMNPNQHHFHPNAMQMNPNPQQAQSNPMMTQGSLPMQPYMPSQQPYPVQQMMTQQPYQQFTFRNLGDGSEEQELPFPSADFLENQRVENEDLAQGAFEMPRYADESNE